jgi:predicted RNA-binding protein YlqC (UPF0109 family)
MTKELSPSGIQLRETFILIAAALDVKHFDDLVINVVEMQSSTTITIDVHGDDFGKLVGKAGVMINSLKALFEIAGVRLGVKVRLILNNPKHGEIGDRPKFQTATNWSNEPIRQLLEKVCKLVFMSPFKVNAGDTGEATTLEIIAEPNERALRQSFRLGKSLGVIFHAVGKVQGRIEVFVDLAPAVLA